MKASVLVANGVEISDEQENQEECEEVHSDNDAPNSVYDPVDFDSLQEHKVAALLLCMQTVLHVSRNSIHVILENINDLLSLSSSHTEKGVEDILRRNNCNCRSI